MRYIDEFRDRKLVTAMADKINAVSPADKINIMEVCGTHTQNFAKFGLAEFLPDNIRFISGPGCPVCVSGAAYIDAGVQLAQDKDKIIATFGDMLRIPGGHSSLAMERARGANIHVVYSCLDSLRIARENKGKKVIFLAVGFETTAPTIALSILAAKKEKLSNLYFLTALKLIPAAMEHLLKDRRLGLSGFLCPGHVSAVIGTRPYETIVKKYGVSCCVAGFEPLDILEGIYLLLLQIRQNTPRVDNQYMRVVKAEGNTQAQAVLREVFKVAAASWRGLGKIPASGFALKDKYSGFDAEKEFSLKEILNAAPRRTRCRCADVLKGLISPDACPLFKNSCTVSDPQGPCMVSSEGACNAYYRYR